MGPEQTKKYATDELAWAKHWPQSMQPTILHGPNPGHPECYRWSCMGPVQAEKYATDELTWAQPSPPSMLPDGLVWAQHWPQSMQPMVLHGPSAGQKVCYR